MLVTELAEVLNLNTSRKDFIKFIRQTAVNTPLHGELTSTTDVNGNGNYLITKRGQEMLIDLLVTTSDLSEKQQVKTRNFMKFNLKWYHILKEVSNEK